MQFNCREANKFLQDQAEIIESSEQKKDTIRRKENGCDEESPMHIGKYLQRQFENILREEIEEMLLSLICGPRSKRHVELSEKILGNMKDVAGEKHFTLQTPKTRQQRIMAFLADQAGKWLLGVVDEADLQLVQNLENKLKGLGDDGGKGDGLGDQTSDEDVEIITKKKMPKGWKDFMNKADEKGDADEKAELKKKEEKPSKKSKVEEEKKEPQSPQEKKPMSRRSSKKTVESQQPSPKKETVVSRSKQSVAPKRETVKSQGPSRTSSKRPSQVPKSKSRSIEIQPTMAQVPPRPSSSRSSKSPPPRPKSSSQARRDLMKKMIGDHISKVVSEQDSKLGTSRLEALKDVISKRLEEKLVPSHTDVKTLDAIKEVTGLISTYVDHVTSKVELEYGNKTPGTNQVPVSQRGAGTVYSVKRAGSALALKTLTHTQAKIGVNLARGLPPPKSANAEFKPPENMIKWTGDVANMAENWNKWIGSTVQEAVQVAEKQKKGIKQDKQIWKEWKDTTGAEALEWRRNKKLIDAQAKQLADKENVTKSR